MLIKKLLSTLTKNSSFQQQIRCLGKREINLKDPIKEAELPSLYFMIINEMLIK